MESTQAPADRASAHRIRASDRPAVPPRVFPLAKMLALAVCGAAAMGCTPRADIHGDPLVAERVGQVVPGVHRDSDIVAILGSPSTTSPFNPESWYYITARTEAFAFLPRKETERTVVVIRFDQRGVVSEVDVFGKERGQEVELVSRETPTFGNDLSLVQEFFGNLGRFNTEQTDPGSRRGR